MMKEKSELLFLDLGNAKVWGVLKCEGKKKKKGCVECSVKKTVRNPTAIFYFGEPLWG